MEVNDSHVKEDEIFRKMRIMKQCFSSTATSVYNENEEYNTKEVGISLNNGNCIKIGDNVTMVRKDYIDKMFKGLSKEDIKNAVYDQIIRFGYTLQQVQQIFSCVETWLPTRYEWVMLALNSDIMGGDNRLMQESISGPLGLFNMPSKGRLYDSIRNENKIQSTPSHFSRPSSNRGSKNFSFREIDAERKRDFAMMQQRCMIDVHSMCNIKCNTDLIDNVIPLYACRDHGIVHICTSQSEGCIMSHITKSQERICIFSKIKSDSIVISTRSYNTRSDYNYVGTHNRASSCSRMKMRKLKRGFKWLGNTHEEEYKNERRIIELENNGYIRFVMIEDLELNYAMMESAVNSGRGCVVTEMASDYLIKKYYTHEHMSKESKMMRNIEQYNMKSKMYRDNELLKSLSPVSSSVSGINIGNVNSKTFMASPSQMRSGSVTPYTSSTSHSPFHNGNNMSQSKNTMSSSSRYNVMYTPNGALVAQNKYSRSNYVCNTPTRFSDPSYSYSGASSSRRNTKKSAVSTNKGNVGNVNNNNKSIKWCDMEDTKMQYGINPYTEVDSRKKIWDSVVEGIRPHYIINKAIRQTSVSVSDNESLSKNNKGKIKNYDDVEYINNKDDFNVSTSSPHLYSSDVSSREHISSSLSPPKQLHLKQEKCIISDIPHNNNESDLSYHAIINSGISGGWEEEEDDYVKRDDYINYDDIENRNFDMYGGKNSYYDDYDYSDRNEYTGVDEFGVNSVFRGISSKRKGKKKKNKGSSPKNSKFGYTLGSDGSRHKTKENVYERIKTRMKTETETKINSSEIKIKQRKNNIIDTQLYKASRLNDLDYSKKEVEQFFIVDGSGSMTVSSFNKKKKRNRKNGPLMGNKYSGILFYDPNETDKHENFDSIPLIMGDSAGVLMGKPSLESMKKIVLSKSVTDSLFAEKGFQKEKTNMDKKNNNNTVLDNNKIITQATKTAYILRYEKFNRWLNAESMVPCTDMKIYKSIVSTVMEDIIFNTEKRKSMILAYNYAAIINTKDEIRLHMSKIEKDIKIARIQHEEAENNMRQKYGILECKNVSKTPLEMIMEFYDESESDKKLKLKLLRIDKYASNVLSNRLKKRRHSLSFFDEEDKKNEYAFYCSLNDDANLNEEINIGKKRKRRRKRRRNIKYIPNLGEMDDLYAQCTNKDVLEIVQYDTNKMQQYTNEIVLLWRILSACPNFKAQDSPLSQFEYFVLGILYTLSDTDICINGKVILEKDSWLTKVLPTKKMLCVNYINRLKKKHVAKFLQLQTNLDESMLTFSTPSHSYTSKIVTRGCTRVKNILNSYSGMVDEDLIRNYTHQNSNIEYIKVNETAGNVRRAARIYKKTPGLFE